MEDHAQPEEEVHMDLQRRTGRRNNLKFNQLQGSRGKRGKKDSKKKKKMSSSQKKLIPYVKSTMQERGL